ncbi:hypothetical protein T484DRAFT_1760547 [Baffinella frigidus]|nr:hypothetical protein T484DRAFT_1760547 [Cryptophyta sp. CCMP2293]
MRGPAALRLMLGLVMAQSAVGGFGGAAGTTACPAPPLNLPAGHHWVSSLGLRGGEGETEDEEASLVAMMDRMRIGPLLLPPAEGHETQVLAGSAGVQRKNNDHAGHAYHDLVRRRAYPDEILPDADGEEGQGKKKKQEGGETLEQVGAPSTRPPG